MKNENGGSQECGSTKETMKYIEERSENLSNYSDKLRKAVDRVFNQFGASGQYCAVCSCRTDSPIHTREDHEGYHAHIPKTVVYVSYFLEFHVETDDENRYDILYEIGIGKGHELGIYRKERADNGEVYSEYWMTAPYSRELLKKVITSNAIPRFLEGLKKKIEETETEYAEVSAIAERMAQAI